MSKFSLIRSIITGAPSDYSKDNPSLEVLNMQDADSFLIIHTLLGFLWQGLQNNQEVKYLLLAFEFFCKPEQSAAPTVIHIWTQSYWPQRLNWQKALKLL